MGLAGRQSNQKGRENETQPRSDRTERGTLLPPSVLGWSFVGRPAQRINPEAVVSERFP